MSANSDSFATIDRHTNGTCEVLRMRPSIFAFLRNLCFMECDGMRANGTKLEFSHNRITRRFFDNVYHLINSHFYEIIKIVHWFKVAWWCFFFLLVLLHIAIWLKSAVLVCYHSDKHLKQPAQRSCPNVLIIAHLHWIVALLCYCNYWYSIIQNNDKTS